MERVTTGTENGSTPCYSLFLVVLTAQTWGLLSRGSQVRILPGAPLPKESGDLALGCTIWGEGAGEKSDRSFPQIG